MTDSQPPSPRGSFVVVLNGTTANPYQALGLARNPFPASPRSEHARNNDTLSDLATRCIVNTADLRERLRGWSPEFVALCVAQYRKGQVIRFRVSYPAANGTTNHQGETE
jgi:hypothetical protein